MHHTMSPQTGNPYDIVVKNGRVMDPFTRTDIKAHVGIADGKIAAIIPPDSEPAGRPPMFIRVSPQKAFFMSWSTVFLWWQTGNWPATFPVR